MILTPMLSLPLLLKARGCFAPLLYIHSRR